MSLTEQEIQLVKEKYACDEVESCCNIFGRKLAHIFFKRNQRIIVQYYRPPLGFYFKNKFYEKDYFLKMTKMLAFA
jgi:hypothetical protein